MQRWGSYFKKIRTKLFSKAKYFFKRVGIGKFAEKPSVPENLKPIGTISELAGSLSSIAEPIIKRSVEQYYSNLSDDFALCRIIGNDLVPRHEDGQTYKNLQFTLEQEPHLTNCKKMWVLNRITSHDTESRLIALLEKHDQQYERIPFDQDRFKRIGFDFQNVPDSSVFFDGTLDNLPSADRDRIIVQTYNSKNNYAMNSNNARNFALELCRSNAKWSLPFDGNCFFTEQGWESLVKKVKKEGHNRYFTVPMERLLDNQQALNVDRVPNLTEEPQIIFRKDASLSFNPIHPYGRRPKVELLVALGVKGPWSKWKLYPYDMEQRRVSNEGHRVGTAGWVSRLYSGKCHLEENTKLAFIERGQTRTYSIISNINRLEKEASFFNSSKPSFYDLEALKNCKASKQVLFKMADDALMRGPYSVTDKPNPGPSGNLHDYFHAAPYWWPNPNTKTGLPYIYKDGERVLGTELYGQGSDSYDRSRLQRLFEDTLVLALANAVKPNVKYKEHALLLVRTWFIEPKHKMNPHLDFAQVRMGQNQNRGTGRGIIETKDFYFFLDAIKLLNDENVIVGVQDWCDHFFNWLKTSPSGKSESAQMNNHGTYYDLQTAAFAAFLGKFEDLQQINHRAQSRIIASIEKDGRQPFEYARTMSQHYATFNLQGWINLFTILESAGLKPWSSEAGARLATAIERLSSDSERGWTLKQVEPFYTPRLLPLTNITARLAQQSPAFGKKEEEPLIFDQYFGIAPFWKFSQA
ncbi:MAG: alginate lyase family protein [Hyphomicrobiales bacterium]